MDNPLGVRGIERIRQLNPPVQQPIHGHRSCAQPTVQSLALQQFHGDKRPDLVLQFDFFNSVDRANVWMIERRGGSCLQQKAVQGILIAGELRRQKLQSDSPPQIKVFSLVDHSHAAASELADDAVMRDGLTDHEWIEWESSS